MASKGPGGRAGRLSGDSQGGAVLLAATSEPSEQRRAATPACLPASMHACSRSSGAEMQMSTHPRVTSDASHSARGDRPVCSPFHSGAGSSSPLAPPRQSPWKLHSADAGCEGRLHSTAIVVSCDVLDDALDSMRRGGLSVASSVVPILYTQKAPLSGNTLDRARPSATRRSSRRRPEARVGAAPHAPRHSIYPLHVPAPLCVRKRRPPYGRPLVCPSACPPNGSSAV